MKAIAVKDESFTTLADGAMELHPLGLTFSRNLQFDEWETAGRSLRQINSGVQWCLGDWLNYGEDHYGEKYAQAVDETDYSYGALRNAAWVARRFDLSRRRDKLAFSHHAEVASLEPAEADKLLDAAAENGWPRKLLRETIKAYKAELSTNGAKPENVSHETAETESPPDLVAELETAHHEIEQQSALIESLTSDDKDRELRKKCADFASLNALYMQQLETVHQLRKDAQYGKDKLRQIRKVLNVEKDRDIIPAIEALRG